MPTVYQLSYTACQINWGGFGHWRPLVSKLTDHMISEDITLPILERTTRGYVKKWVEELKNWNM